MKRSSSGNTASADADASERRAGTFDEWWGRRRFSRAESVSQCSDQRRHPGDPERVDAVVKRSEPPLDLTARGRGNCERRDMAWTDELERLTTYVQVHLGDEVLHGAVHRALMATFKHAKLIESFDAVASKSLMFSDGSIVALDRFYDELLQELRRVVRVH